MGKHNQTTCVFTVSGQIGNADNMVTRILIFTALICLLLLSCVYAAPSKLEPPNNLLYHGVGLNVEDPKFYDYYDNYVALVGHKPKVITFFAPVWSNGQYRDWTFYIKMMEKVDKIGAIPFIKASTADWNTKTGLWWSAEDIIAGKYDSYFSQAADAAKAFKKPLFMSWNHEMNGDWWPWSQAFAAKHPEKSDWTAGRYIKVWQRIIRIFRDRGVTNVAFAWAPDVNGRKIDNYPSKEGWKAYWPGDDFVDWVAPSLYNAISPIELQYLANSYDKPIFISEWATGDNYSKWYPGPYPGDAAWVRMFMDMVLNNIPAVKGISYFNYMPSYYIDRNRAQLEVYKKALSNKRFIDAQ